MTPCRDCSLPAAVREQTPVAPVTAPAPGWRDRAACLGLDVELFHDPERGLDALAVCAGCPVTDPCLEAALTAPVGADVGVWGHTTVEKRRRMRDARRRAQGAV